MNAIQIGNRLVELLDAMEMDKVYAELYSPNIESIEADGMVSKGMEGIHAKNDWWANTFEVLEWVNFGPFPHGESMFCIIYRLKWKNKESGEITEFEEVGVYDVEDGKIVRERFCYTPGA